MNILLSVYVSDLKSNKPTIEALSTIFKYLYKITIYVPVVYLLRDVLILMGATSITRAIGRSGLSSPSFNYNAIVI